jgi:hypothetical protein
VNRIQFDLPSGAFKFIVGDAMNDLADCFRTPHVNAVFPHFPHLNAKFFSSPQRYDNSSVLTVNLRRIAAEPASGCENLVVN